MKKMKEICPKKWGICAIAALAVMVVGMALLTYIIDPYFHYHAPLPGMSYRLYEQRYINDGISRHFEYDAVITGNSLSENFKTTEFDALFDTNSVKLPYSGAGYHELWGNLERTLSYNPDIEKVLVILDSDDIAKDWDYTRYTDYPEYLYDDNIWNDATYLWNKDIFYRGTIYNLLMSVSGEESTTFDEYSAKEEETGMEAVLQYVGDIPDKEDIKLREYDGELEQRVADNINENIIRVVRQYPGVEFTLVFAPSSVAKWCDYYTRGQVEYRIYGAETAIELLLQEENINLYSFQNDFEVTCNFDNYRDTIHYTTDITSYMLETIARDERRLTPDNYQDYINEIMIFYTEYDYYSLKEEE